MDTKTADTITKILAVIVILAGIGMLLAAFGIGWGTSLGLNIPGLTVANAAGTAAGTSLGIAGVIAAVIIGLLYLIVGWGLWTHQNWARITVLILAWIGLIGAILTLFGVGGAANGTARAATITAAVISLIVAVLEIWFFQFTDATRALFTGERVSRAQAHPVAGKR